MVLPGDVWRVLWRRFQRAWENHTGALYLMALPVIILSYVVDDIASSRLVHVLVGLCIVVIWLLVVVWLFGGGPENAPQDK